MTLTFFLRRHRVSPDRLEYFYLTVEGFDISMDDNFIAPGLPRLFLSGRPMIAGLPRSPELWRLAPVLLLLAPIMTKKLTVL